MTRTLNDFIALQREHDRRARLALSGKRVLDISTVIAAPYAAALLGDAGADVIKIEAPNRTDPLRSWQKLPNGIEPFHAHIGRHKYPITLNLKSIEGRSLFLDLVRQSDILIENLRPGALSRLKLSHKLLLKHNPGLIIGTISGYGMSGPKAKQPGFGTLAEAYSGFAHLNGCSDEGPACPPNALADMTSGVHLALAICQALLHQRRGVCGGQIIDMSLYEPLFGYLGGEFVWATNTSSNPIPLRNELQAAAPRNIYRSRDGKWIALSCTSQATWEKLSTLMDRVDLINDSRFSCNEARTRAENRAQLNRIISDWVGSKLYENLLEMVTEAGVTAGPVLDLGSIAKEPHYQKRHSITTVKDPSNGHTIKLPNLPVRKAGETPYVRFPGLPIGSANKIVFAELLNLEEIDQLELAKREII